MFYFFHVFYSHNNASQKTPDFNNLIKTPPKPNKVNSKQTSIQNLCGLRY